MNILYLCDEYPPCHHGGIGTITQILARKLVEKGHQIVICGFYPYYRTALPFENDRGVKVNRYFYGNKIKLKLSKQKYLGRFVNVKIEFNNYLKFLKNTVEECNIEIIEMPDYNEVFRYSGPKFIQFPDFGVPKVVKVHGGDSFFSFIRTNTVCKDLLYRKEEKLLSDASLVLAISEYSKALIKSIFDYRKEIPVIYNGIEINRTINYSEDQYKKTVVFAGTITEKKGIFSLVKSWEKVISEVPESCLYIYGKGSRRTLKYLNNLINDRTKNSIHIEGFTDKETLQKVYSSASCAIFPSYAESFGMAPLEAMVIGCPTIFTRRTSGPELIKDREEGLLVDPDNIEDISQAIIFLLLNREYALETGRNGALKVKSHFDISKIADQHIDLYNKLINNQ
jgi:glycosyltransferase involved in cell wall biosynthesis